MDLLELVSDHDADGTVADEEDLGNRGGGHGYWGEKTLEMVLVKR